MTQDITRQQAGALAPYVAPDVDELNDDYGMGGELRAPFFPYNGKTGVFVHPLTGEMTDAVRLVLLRRLGDSRIMWNPDMKAEQRERIVCASDDTVTARPAADEEAQGRRDALKITGECDSCPMSKFGRDKYGKATKQPCSYYINLAVAEADDEEPIPYHLGIKSTGLKAIKPVLDRWRLVRVAKAVKKVPGYAIVIDLWAGDEAGTPPLTYRPLAARITGAVADKDNWAGLGALYRAIQGLPIDVVAQAMEADAPDEDLVDSQAEPDYGEEPHVETAEEFQARMDAEEAEERARQAYPEAAGSRNAPSSEAAKQEPAAQDCHSLPADAPMTAWETLGHTPPGDPVNSARGRARR